MARHSSDLELVAAAGSPHPDDERRVRKLGERHLQLAPDVRTDLRGLRNIIDRLMGKVSGRAEC